jgi:hypothetical protein
LRHDSAAHRQHRARGEHCEMDTHGGRIPQERAVWRRGM